MNRVFSVRLKRACYIPDLDLRSDADGVELSDCFASQQSNNLTYPYGLVGSGQCVTPGAGMAPALGGMCLQRRYA